MLLQFKKTHFHKNSCRHRLETSESSSHMKKWAITFVKLCDKLKQSPEGAL